MSLLLTTRRWLSNQPLEWTGLHQLFAAPPRSPCLPLRGSVGKMPTAGAGEAMLREAFNTSLVTNRLPGRGISFLLLFTGGASSSRPCQSS